MPENSEQLGPQEALRLIARETARQAQAMTVAKWEALADGADGMLPMCGWCEFARGVCEACPVAWFLGAGCDEMVLYQRWEAAWLAGDQEAARAAAGEILTLVRGVGGWLVEAAEKCSANFAVGVGT